MATGKSEVVSVRVEPHIKVALQSAAEREMRSIANMLEVMVIAYCRTNGYLPKTLSRVQTTPSSAIQPMPGLHRN